MAQRSSKSSQTIVAPHLSASEIRRLPKPRPGFVQFAQEVVATLKARPDAVMVKGLDPDAVLTSLEAYAKTAADVAAKKAAYLAAADAQLLLGSSIWSDTLVGYQHIKVAARVDGRLQTALEPLERFMKPRRARRKAASSPAQTAQTTPVAAR